ncbi:MULTISPECIES: hypothetical protein [unclassified Streptomyces]|uniref:hypothetical protein n=1 Tax=unclassified Streptomyces TaxID=2593676 RepID=UPI0033309217
MLPGDDLYDLWGSYLQDEWRRERFIKAIEAMEQMNAEKRTQLREDMAQYVAGKPASSTLRDSFRQYIEKEAAHVDGRSSTERPGTPTGSGTDTTSQASTEGDGPGDDDCASPGAESGPSD